MTKPRQSPSEKNNFTSIYYSSYATEERITPHHKINRIKEQEVFKKIHLGLFKTLTKRELEIIKLLVKGRSNPQVADQLYISRSTVEQHRKNINRKLKVKSFTELFQYALAFDLI